MRLQIVRFMSDNLIRDRGATDFSRQLIEEEQNILQVAAESNIADGLQVPLPRALLMIPTSGHRNHCGPFAFLLNVIGATSITQESACRRNHTLVFSAGAVPLTEQQDHVGTVELMYGKLLMCGVVPLHWFVMMSDKVLSAHRQLH